MIHTVLACNNLRMLCWCRSDFGFLLAIPFCIWDGSRTLRAHFRALPHADSDFIMMCAISAAESESVKGGIDDMDLNY